MLIRHFFSMSRRKLTLGLKRRGCFPAGLVSWYSSQKRSRCGVRTMVRCAFGLAVYETTAKENMAQQHLRNKRIPCNRCRDALVCTATDNACVFSWDVVLMVSNSTLCFCKDICSTTDSNQGKAFFTLKLFAFSFKQSRSFENSWKSMVKF